MFRCLLVDDEYYARQRVRRCVEWEALGFTVAGEAASVREALEKLECEPFHLAVVDVTMPGESGLDLIAKAAEDYPELAVIVLSGYAEFEYARQAMRCGVEHYLTKPVNRREMEQALAGVARLLEQRQGQKAGVFWRQFFHSEALLDGEEESLPLAQYGIVPKGQYRVLMGEVRGVQTLRFSRQRRQNQEVAQLLAQRFSRWVRAACLDSFGHALLVVQMPEDQADEPILQEMVALAQQHLDEAYVLGCGGPGPGRAIAMQEAYRQACLAFLSKLFYPMESLVLHSPGGRVAGPGLAQQNQRVERCLQTGDRKQLEKALNEVFEALAQQGDVHTLEAELAQLLGLLKTQASHRQMEQYQMENRLIGMGCREMMAGSDTLAQLQERLRQLFEPFLGAGEGTETTSRLVREATSWMEELYRSYGFGLEELAVRLMVSPAYLSSQFKKHTGLTVTQYISKLRMEEAGRLLRQPQQSIAQVAEALGFADAFYFSKSFKKHYGMPPSAYRENT